MKRLLFLAALLGGSAQAALGMENLKGVPVCLGQVLAADKSLQQQLFSSYLTKYSAYRLMDRCGTLFEDPSLNFLVDYDGSKAGTYVFTYRLVVLDSRQYKDGAVIWEKGGFGRVTSPTSQQAFSEMSKMIDTALREFMDDYAAEYALANP